VISKLVLENLKHRPMRSLLSILLIGVPVTLILCLIGLSRGLLEDGQTRSRGVGADIIIRGSTSSSIASFSGTSIPEALVAKVEQQPHVQMALGVVVHSFEIVLNVMGVDADKFNRMSGGFTYLSGGPLQHPYDVLVDEYYAAQKHLKVGDTYRMLNHDWRVTGIIAVGKLSRIVVDERLLQELDAATNKVSLIYVKCDRPAQADEVAAELERLLPGYPIYTMKAFTAMFSVGNVQGLSEFIAVIVGIGVVIGFAVVCLSMYMAVLQRTREIGILKSLGASRAFILCMILSEALMMALGGTVLGILMSYAATWLIHVFVPAAMPMAIVKIWWLIAGGVTVTGASLGALYPGLAAARHDPIEALAYE
jgi:putative ABC transport system permease protein